jgi:hypothetical protein
MVVNVESLTGLRACGWRLYLVSSIASLAKNLGESDWHGATFSSNIIIRVCIECSVIDIFAGAKPGGTSAPNRHFPSWSYTLGEFNHFVT